jgi:hypothetical protein
MRIYQGKYYILEYIPGCSGFKQWNKREYRIVNASLAKVYRLQVVREFLFNGGKFRLEDGHLPEYQKTTGLISELFSFLDSHGKAFILTPELYDLKVEV